MNLRLEGKRALVTGSSSGIGEVIAHALAEEGVAVVVHGRSQERAQRVAREIASKGGRAAHEQGVAHQWSSEEARQAGRKGGMNSRGGRRDDKGQNSPGNPNL